MARMRLIDLLSYPGNLDEKTLDSLKEALDAYPFFQAGRMLWIKNLHKLDHIRYNSELKLAAAFIPDRSKLFFLINDVFSSLSVPDRTGSEAEDEKKTEECPKMQDTQQNVASESDDRNKAGAKNESDSSHLKKREGTDDRARQSEEGLDQIVGADANYFEVDDSFTSAAGEIIDFSLPRSNEEDPGSNSKEIPSSKLLDYEKEAYSSAYFLEDEIPPSALDLNENHSFSEWLDLLKNQSAAFPGDRRSDTGNQQKASNKSGKMNLIDNFLNSTGTQKRIVPLNENSAANEDFSVSSVQEREDLMTETLANIHIKQKRYQKAIEIFERLSLKYPEKSVYFANRIKEMEDLINNQ